MQDNYLFSRRIYQYNNVGIYQALRKDGQVVCCLKIVVSAVDDGMTLVPLPIEVCILRYLQSALVHSPYYRHIQKLHMCYGNEVATVLVSGLERNDPYEEYVWSKPSVIRSFMRQLVSTVACIHGAGVIHRDIKPSNVLFNKDTGWITVIDFDLSVYGKEEPKEAVGTDGFMAPEIMAHLPESDTYSTDAVGYSYAVDVYAIGVLFGCLLFQTSEVDVLDSTVAQWRTNGYSTACDNAALDLFHQMTHSNPSDRPLLSSVLRHMYF
jgi:serine/threonine protein kinase